jgi:hypothetical protein
MNFDQEMKELDEIQELVAQGVLGRELCPDPYYWHWPILKPEALPAKFSASLQLGEVRW